MEDIVENVGKGVKRVTIVWNSSCLKELLSYIYSKKYHTEKSFSKACDKVAILLVAESPLFKGQNLSGAVCKSRAEIAIAAYETKFLEQGNKSGFTGDRDDENNYTDVEWLAKKIHEEMEENKAQKEGMKLAKDKLEKDKCGLEVSAMSLANRGSKSILDRLGKEGVK